MPATSFFFREPDASLFGLGCSISMGHRLSLPTIAAGVWRRALSASG